jgi:imipenem/basic amino acid-specific outer membrane pore
MEKRNIKPSFIIFLVTHAIAVAGGDITPLNPNVDIPKQTNTSLIKETNGYLRAGYQNTDITNDTDYTDTALGGKLHIVTHHWHGLSFGTSLYTTHTMGNNEGNGIPFFNSHNKSYAILGEAYLQGEFDNTTLKVGRQEIDTPFADTDDIGMVPNTFETALLINKDIAETTLILAHITKWAGVDADSPEKFTKLNGEDGLQVVSIMNESIKGLSLGAWYYHAKHSVKIPYFEAHYETNLAGIALGLGLQYTQQTWEDAPTAKIVGVNISTGFESIGLSLNAAYNKSREGTTDNLFGGGPFFINAAHLTLPQAGADGKGTLLSAEWDTNVIGVKNLTLATGYLTLEDNRATKATELDLTASYTFSEVLSLDVIYSKIDNNIAGDDVTNVRVFVNYLF